MNPPIARVVRAATLLAIQLLILDIWGFAALDKWMNGMPGWFDGKFGPTILGTFPGARGSFWILAVSETIAFLLALTALVRGEFLERRPVTFLPLSIAVSLFVFLELGFGLWLTKDFHGVFQQFMYFCGTLVALQTAVGGPVGCHVAPPTPMRAES